MKQILLALFFISSLFGLDDLGKAISSGTLSENQINELISKCNSGDGASCKNIANFYSNKNLSGNNNELMALSIEYNTKACNLKIGAACNSLGGYYERGEGIAQDSTKAIEYYIKGCDYNSGVSCNSLGSYYNKESKAKSGADKKATELKAKRFYKKACDLGYRLGCDM